MTTKKILFLFIFILTVFLPIFSFSLQCNAQDYGVGDTFSKIDNNPYTGDQNIKTKAGTIIGSILAFVGIAFFVLMIYGGFLWMFARGDEGQVTKAKDLITTAVVGLIIILSAYAITSYIGNVMTGK